MANTRLQKLDELDSQFVIVDSAYTAEASDKIIVNKKADIKLPLAPGGSLIYVKNISGDTIKVTPVENASLAAGQAQAVIKDGQVFKFFALSENQWKPDIYIVTITQDPAKTFLYGDGTVRVNLVAGEKVIVYKTDTLK